MRLSYLINFYFLFALVGASCDVNDVYEHEQMDLNSAAAGIVVEPPTDPHFKRILGDVNKDYEINIDDAMVAAHMVIGAVDEMPEDYSSEAADINCDFKITPVDTLLIAQYAVGLIDNFPCMIQSFTSQYGIESREAENLQYKKMQITAQDGNKTGAVFLHGLYGLGVYVAPMDGTDVLDFLVNGSEELIFTFDAPMTMLYVGFAVQMNLNGNSTTDEIEVEAFGADGQSMGTKLFKAWKDVDVSTMFDGQAIKKMILRPTGDGFGVRDIFYSDTQSVKQYSPVPIDLTNQHDEIWDTTCYENTDVTPTDFYSAGADHMKSDTCTFMVPKPTTISTCVNTLYTVDWEIESNCTETENQKCAQAHMNLINCSLKNGKCWDSRSSSSASIAGDALNGTITEELFFGIRPGFEFSNSIIDEDATTEFTYTVSNATMTCVRPSYGEIMSPAKQKIHN